MTTTAADVSWLQFHVDGTAFKDDFPGRTFAGDTDDDVAPQWRKHPGTCSQAQAEPPCGIVPGGVDFHELPFAEVESLPVVFIQCESGVRSRIHPQSQRTVDLLVGVLLHRPERYYGAGAYVQGHDREVDSPADLLPADH